MSPKTSGWLVAAAALAVAGVGVVPAGDTAAPAAQATGVAGSAARAPEVGDLAPAFTMPGSDGKTYTLADFKGKKVVVLAWFPKAFTGG